LCSHTQKSQNPLSGYVKAAVVTAFNAFQASFPDCTAQDLNKALKRSTVSTNIAMLYKAH